MVCAMISYRKSLSAIVYGYFDKFSVTYMYVRSFSDLLMLSPYAFSF